MAIAISVTMSWHKGREGGAASALRLFGHIDEVTRNFNGLHTFIGVPSLYNGELSFSSRESVSSERRYLLSLKSLCSRNRG